MDPRVHVHTHSGSLCKDFSKHGAKQISLIKFTSSAFNTEHNLSGIYMFICIHKFVISHVCLSNRIICADVVWKWICLCAHAEARLRPCDVSMWFYFWQVKHRCLWLSDNGSSQSLSCLSLCLIVRMDVFLMAEVGEAEQSWRTGADVGGRTDTLVPWILDSR